MPSLPIKMIAQLIGLSIILLGFVAGIFALNSVHHKYHGLWVTCAAACLTIIGFCWKIQEQWLAKESNPNPEEMIDSSDEPINALQRLQFAKFLQYAPKGPVTVASFDADDATVVKLKLIRGMLDSAGYKAASPDEEIRTFPGGSLDSPYKTHFFIVGRDAMNMPPYAGALKAAFKEVGIDAWFLTNNHPDPTVTPDQVFVFYVNEKNKD